MRVCVAVIQSVFQEGLKQNLERAKEKIHKAALAGAQIILLPELFQGPYFCQTQDEQFFSQAWPWREHPCVIALSALAKALKLVIPVSIFERDGVHYYNTVVLLDTDGEALGIYRKSHIPDGTGYQEKFYFRPGNTGFKVWKTAYGQLGVGICWDQWFPEAARSMTLLGADLLLYPTAIGSEPSHPDLLTLAPWRRVMQGQAVANIIPVAAANRTGKEKDLSFYGSSFLCDPYGEIIASLGQDEEGFALAEFDFEAYRRLRASWGFFRDRRPDLYLS